MVKGQWSMRVRVRRARQARRASPLAFHPSPFTAYVSCLTRYASRDTLHASRYSDGFTILEMLIVLFLLSVVVVVVLPRISLDEDLSSTGRKLIGVIRTFQGLAATSQQPLKLYLDLDQGTYWMMMVEGKDERIPLDPAWKLPRSLPESIRLTEVSVGQDKHFSGRVDISFFANGRIEPVTMYLTDAKNNLLGLAVDSLTGWIRVSDERFDVPRHRFIPDRVRTLLKARSQPGAAETARGGIPNLQ